MSRSIGITDFLNKRFDYYPLEGNWKQTLGVPEKNFRMIVYGHPGNGKTEFCIQMAKMMAKHCKVYFNSFEQGISKSLQDALIRNEMHEVSGRVMFGDKESFDEMIARLKGKNSPKVVFIDSRDYLNLTDQQFKKLIELFPRKSFVIICWELAQKPRGQYAKAIEYMCDIKVHVKGFRAYPRSRFGGNLPFVIWDKPTNVSVANDLFNQPQRA
jgi:hypothetical protein